MISPSDGPLIIARFDYNRRIESSFQTGFHSTSEFVCTRWSPHETALKSFAIDSDAEWIRIGWAIDSNRAAIVSRQWTTLPGELCATSWRHYLLNGGVNSGRLLRFGWEESAVLFMTLVSISFDCHRIRLAHGTRETWRSNDPPSSATTTTATATAATTTKRPEIQMWDKNFVGMIHNWKGT